MFSNSAIISRDPIITHFSKISSPYRMNSGLAISSWPSQYVQNGVPTLFSHRFIMYFVSSNERQIIGRWLYTEHFHSTVRNSQYPSPFPFGGSLNPFRYNSARIIGISNSDIGTTEQHSKQPCLHLYFFLASASRSFFMVFWFIISHSKDLNKFLVYSDYQSPRILSIYLTFLYDILQVSEVRVFLVVKVLNYFPYVTDFFIIFH